MPLFIYFIMVFLFFIQVFALHEHIQAAITRMGMDLSKAAYIYQDFPTAEDTLSFDFSIFNDEFELKPSRLADELATEVILGYYVREVLDGRRINDSCIAGGIEGLSFAGSDIYGNGDELDIVVSYKVNFPLKLFIIDDIRLTQRVRMRKWTGYKLPAVYGPAEEERDEQTVYITGSGSVYHTSPDCSHIKLSIRAVTGIPDNARNESGGKYYPCELCCSGEADKNGIYYITSYGSRYHTFRECSRIKRDVREIKLSEVGSRPQCKRCAKQKNSG